MAKYKTGIERFYEYVARLEGVLQFMSGLPQEQQNPVVMAVVGQMIKYDKAVIDAAENQKPLACTWYGNAQEITSAMDIVTFNPVVDLMFHLNLTDYADAKDCDGYKLDDKICSLVRYAVYAMENKLLPRPSVFIAMAEPCDGQVMLHQAFARLDHLKGVPYFPIDPSYGHTDDDFRHVARQLKTMIGFLEEKTGAKYDPDRLREVCLESNKQYRVWGEVNQYLAASPCPMPSFAVPDAFWALTQHFYPCGNPENTKIMELVRDVCKQNVANHVGPVMNEKIRLFWPDLNCLWGEKLGQWLAEEWSAVIVNTFQGLTPYTDIDVSSEESMLFGIARRSVAEVPMIRQGRGWVDVVVEDVKNAIQDYNIDGVLFSGHMGHKDQSGINYFMKQACRDMNTPLLTLTTSLFDERYTPLEKVKNDISNWLSALGYTPNKKV